MNGYTRNMKDAFHFFVEALYKVFWVFITSC